MILLELFYSSKKLVPFPVPKIQKLPKVKYQK